MCCPQNLLFLTEHGEHISTAAYCAFPTGSNWDLDCSKWENNTIQTCLPWQRSITINYQQNIALVSKPRLGSPLLDGREAAAPNKAQ